MESAMSDGKKKIILIFVFLISLFFIFFRFTDIPKVWVDEGVFTQVAENVALHGTLGLQTAPGEFFPMGVLLSNGYPVIYPIALSFKLFGVGLRQARLIMVLYMCALVVLYYIFAKKRYGFLAAILSVLSLISFAPFYGNGRSVLGEVPGLVFIVFGSICFLYWQESGFEKGSWAFWGGLAFGLSAAIKPIYLILLSATLFCVLCVWFCRIERKKTIVCAIIGYCIPLVAWLLIQFGSWELIRHIIPTFIHLAGNHDNVQPIRVTLLSNFKRFFTESTPMLFACLTAIVLGTFFVRSYKKLLPVSMSESILLCFIILNAIAYTFGTGWYRYFFPGDALVYLLFPGAIFLVTEMFSGKKYKTCLLLIPVVLIPIQFYQLFFLSDSSPIQLKTRDAELATSLSVISATSTVSVYNVPETVVFLPTQQYSQYLSMGDFLEAGNEKLLRHPTADFILTNDAFQGYNQLSSCYTERTIDRYILFTKVQNCVLP